MDNKSIAKKFKLYSQLMELHEQNPFRTKSIASAAFKIDKLPFPAESSSIEQLSEAPGIGKSTAEKIVQIIQTGTLPELDELLSATPVGIVEMLNIKGLGPKKILSIWKNLEIESVGELYYACNENRLLEAKGFGSKTQEDIKKSIEFGLSNQGWFLYAKARPSAENVVKQLSSALSDTKIVYTGAYRRCCEVLQSIDLLLQADSNTVINALRQAESYTDISIENNRISFSDALGFPFHLYCTDEAQFAKQWILTTGSEEHLQQLGANPSELPALASEELIYQGLGLAYIVPELREGTDEVKKDSSQNLPSLITMEDLRGSLHNHSTYSDGVHSLEQMATYCKEEMGLQYLGICDHSKTAVYANGLQEERILEQWKEIDALNEKLAPFKIFKGIESDILGDGSLDYSDELLAGFDFVVASIHSNLKMDKEKATARLIKAIENPYTTILGHPTGRLLLARAGYPIDHQKVIDACAANQVTIEINANPLRLDLDWRWHQYALEKGVMLSINPDAHRMEGFHDMEYGVLIGRKGGLTADRCLNALSLEDIQTYFDQRKAKI